MVNTRLSSSMNRVSVLVVSAAVVALVWHAWNMPELKENSKSLPNRTALQWVMTESSVGDKNAYRLESVSGKTDWDKRFSDKATNWLFVRKQAENTLLLQCQDGSLYELNLENGCYEERVATEEPLQPAARFFSELEGA